MRILCLTPLRCLTPLLLVLVIAGCASGGARPGPGESVAGQAMPEASPVIDRREATSPPTSGRIDPAFQPGARGGLPRHAGAGLTQTRPQTQPQAMGVQLDARVPPARFDENLAAYLIGPQDLLRVQVFEVEELSSKVRVNRQGYITMPLIGSVQVAGYNITEVERLIEQHLQEEYLQDPHVAVFIEEFASQRITVAGYVAKPGVFAMQGQTTLLQAIAMAGGVSEIADTDQIFVFRNPYGDKRSVLEFNLDDIEDGKVVDPLLRGTDMVVVDSSSGRKLLRDVTGTLRGFVGFGTLPVF